VFHVKRSMLRRPVTAAPIRLRNSNNSVPARRRGEAVGGSDRNPARAGEEQCTQPRTTRNVPRPTRHGPRATSHEKTHGRRTPGSDVRCTHRTTHLRCTLHGEHAVELHERHPRVRLAPASDSAWWWRGQHGAYACPGPVSGGAHPRVGGAIRHATHRAPILVVRESRPARLVAPCLRRAVVGPSLSPVLSTRGELSKALMRAECATVFHTLSTGRAIDAE